MRYACVIKLDFSIHELSNGCISPSAKEMGKSMGIIYGESQEECSDKINDILLKNNLRIIEVKNERQPRT